MVAGRVSGERGRRPLGALIFSPRSGNDNDASNTVLLQVLNELIHTPPGKSSARYTAGAVVATIIIISNITIITTITIVTTIIVTIRTAAITIINIIIIVMP